MIFRPKRGAVGLSIGALFLSAPAAFGQFQGLFDREPELRPGLPQSAELAGNALPVYPHFEYVRAFNEGSSVSFALDPTRFPRIGGQTVDLYVVDARSRAQWIADRTLTDVRGGPQTATLGSTTIQSCTVALTGSEALSGQAGTGLGVGYDLVCDVNRNGRLDDVDFIDGFDEVAGLFVVHDVTQPGPLPVTETMYSVEAGSVTPGFEAENLFYPTNIAMMGRLPLIVVSHGNGHNFQWYDHIGFHMASYGYVVMSHQNNTMPGVETAATTTLEHMDAFLGQLDTIEGGLLQGHIDTSRVVWIGHSRGGEGVAIAYNRLIQGTVLPTNYRIADIVLVSSIAPVDFTGPGSANPRGIPYSLWTGGADADVDGCADSSVAQTFPLHDRADGWRQSISLHGVGHADFHNGGGSSVASGPCLVGRGDTHQIMRGYLLPLVKHYAEGNVPARDYLWRQWESFRPIGAPVDNPCVTVDLMFREDPEADFVVDDYQEQADLNTSSSGGAVSLSVDGATEGLLDDANTTFTNNAGDIMNGMTLARPNDESRGIVFDWDADASYELAVIPEERDFRSASFLSFRACQTTRHPSTTADQEDLTFRVTLVDGAGGSSSIGIGAYGGGIEEPYQRTGCGAGTGWANEFETVRIRLTDFLNNGATLDLANVASIRFEFGPSFGSPEGRIGLDDISVTQDSDPPFVGALSLTLLSDLFIVPPGTPFEVMVGIEGAGEGLVPGSAMLNYRVDGGSFTSVPLVPTGSPGLFSAFLPGFSCGGTPEVFVIAEGDVTGPMTVPADAPAATIEPVVGTLSTVFEDDFETDQGWTTEVLGASTGFWQRGVPVDDSTWDFDPAADGDGSGSCYLTQNELGNTDIDDGTVRLVSPSLDLSADLIRIRYLYFLRLTQADGVDRISVEYDSNDGAGPWIEVRSLETDGGLSWRPDEITTADILAAGGVPSSTARIRFTSNDSGDPSINESGIDGFVVEMAQCE